MERIDKAAKFVREEIERLLASGRLGPGALQLKTTEEWYAAVCLALNAIQSDMLPQSIPLDPDEPLMRFGDDGLFHKGPSLAETMLQGGTA
jgi:hypothetical protein